VTTIWKATAEPPVRLREAGKSSSVVYVWVNAPEAGTRAR
jgi:hypothetical protein